MRYHEELENPRGVPFKTLLNICVKYFGDPRIEGSLHIFKTPWGGNPAINLQEDEKIAKPYQVKLVKSAIARLEETADAGKDG